jgi:tetratricopeptide (TPR) repeat protein
MTTCSLLKRSRASCCAVACATLLFSGLAHAQSEDQAAARTLFNEGKKLLEQKQYPAACAKLDAARKLYVSAGILLNLADCYDKIGRSASAWTEFGEAASAAENANRTDQVKEAKRRQAAIEPKLARLLVRVPRAVKGLSIKRNESALGAAAWGAAIPVDPGTHEIRAEASGYETWTKSVEVTVAGQTTTVDVPELHRSAATAPIPTTPSENLSRERKEVGAAAESDTGTTPAASRSHVLDWVLIGSGVAIGLGGGSLMLVESNRAQQARDRDDLAAYNQTKTAYYVGLGGAIAGGAVAATGMLLFAMHKGKGTVTTGTVATPWVATGSGGVSLSGRWW